MMISPKTRMAWRITTVERNELATTYLAAQTVADGLVGDNSLRADAVRWMASLLDTWSKRDTLAGITPDAIADAHKAFDDAGPVLADVRRMFDEVIRARGPSVND